VIPHRACGDPGGRFLRSSVNIFAALEVLMVRHRVNDDDWLEGDDALVGPLLICVLVIAACAYFGFRALDMIGVVL
jgi:hypothetical protein